MNDCIDLLEEVQIYNLFNNDCQYTQLDNIISENDMMISIYETQRMLVEQDALILQELGYINEGSENILKKILKGINFIIEKVKDLIKRFINFIKGNRKDKETKIDKENMSKSEIKNAIDTIKNYKKSKKNSSAQNSIDQEIEKIINSEKYIEVKFNNDQAKTDKIMPINDNKLVVSIYAAIDQALKMINDNEYNNEDINQYIKNKGYKELDSFLNGENKSILSLNGKEIINELDLTLPELIVNDSKKITIEKFQETFSDKLYNFLSKYNDDSFKIIKDMQNTLQSKINPLDSKIKQLENKIQESENNTIFNVLRRCVTVLLNIYTEYIRQMTNIERGYKISVQNIETLMPDMEKLNNMKTSYNSKTEKGPNDFHRYERIEKGIKKNNVKDLRHAMGDICYTCRDFSDGEFDKILQYIESKGIKIREDQLIGELVSANKTTYTGRDFVDAVLELKGNFCDARINDVKKIGRYLCGK